MMLINHFPFRKVLYDQYHMSGGEPYQRLFDYVKDRGGVTFWAHPEVSSEMTVSGIKLKTPSYEWALRATQNYTGFAYFYEGYRSIGKPGGSWDQILAEYCNGKREFPIWAIGELDYESTGSLSTYMKDLKTVVLVPQFSQQEILESLKNGRAYIVRGLRKERLVLEEFLLKDPETGKTAHLGEEIFLKSSPHIVIKGLLVVKDHLDQQNLITVNLIRNGEKIQTFKSAANIDIHFQDPEPLRGQKSFYRIEIIAPQKTLISNPIFAKIN